MTSIEIKNIGPIKEVKFNLNQINVFMGPQSSGKSTIAKIISYCTWVEKDVATSQSLSEYQKNNDYFKERLESYHKLKGYFCTDSFIEYKSNVIELQYCLGKLTISWGNRYAYLRSKISYIPSERNMILLPEIEKVEFPKNNIRSFLFDWFDARKNYSKENNLPILGLGVDFYYNESNQENHISGKEDYDLLLSNASSGLQSITPLIAMVEYLSVWIFNKEENISFEQKQKQQNTIKILNQEKLYKSDSEQEKQEKSLKYIAQLMKEDKDAIQATDEIIQIMHGLFDTHNSQFIIEEPEQNLFPETQRDLVYHLLEKCLNKEGNRLTITTHSPYVLYALNNCMLGGLVNNQLQGKEKEEFLNNNLLSKQSWINPQFVSVWEINDDGTIRSIQDKDNIIAENYFDIKMTELTDEYYQILNYYQDEE
jgi:predicted ATPase